MQARYKGAGVTTITCEVIDTRHAAADIAGVGAAIRAATNREAAMRALNASNFLRSVLLVDAVISGATGLLMLAGAGMLQTMLGIPADLLRGAGSSLLPFAAFVGYLASQRTPAAAAVWTVIGLNVVWVVGSVALLAGGSLEPNGQGSAFIVAQAVGVGVLSELEYVGLRRSAPAAA